MAKALIAMSGGVDSSVAAYLMQQRGFDCTGITLKLFDSETDAAPGEKTCCSLDDVEDARSVCRRLEIPHFVYNFKDSFSENVIARFIRAYETGCTPNPCIDCNRYIKFDKLIRRAEELDFDCVVTGHYARVEYDDISGLHIILSPVYEVGRESLLHICDLAEIVIMESLGIVILLIISSFIRDAQNYLNELSSATC